MHDGMQRRGGKVETISWQAIKRASESFDGDVVENSLLKYAMGYEYDGVTTVRDKVVKVVTKLMASGVTACIFWRKNGKPRAVDRCTSSGCQHRAARGIFYRADQRGHSSVGRSRLRSCD